MLASRHAPVHPRQDGWFVIDWFVRSSIRLGRFGRELSTDNSTFVQWLTESAHRVVTDLSSTVSMRCELENTLKSRQHRRQTPDFSFRHRPIGCTCGGTTDHAHGMKAPN